MFFYYLGEHIRNIHQNCQICSLLCRKCYIISERFVLYDLVKSSNIKILRGQGEDKMHRILEGYIESTTAQKSVMERSYVILSIIT